MRIPKYLPVVGRALVSFDSVFHCECSAEEQRCNALGAETPVEAIVLIAEKSEPAVDLLRSPTVWQTHRDEATGVVF